MKKRMTLGLLLLMAAAGPLSAQQRPAEFKMDWKQAGCQSKVWSQAKTVNVRTYGLKQDEDIAPVINSITRSFNGRAGIIYFPSGTYTLKSTVYLQDSIILRGAGSDSTTINIQLEHATSNGIEVYKDQNSAVFRNIGYGPSVGSRAIKATLSGLQAGDYIELRESNGKWDTQPASWAKNVVGQIVQVSRIAADSIYLVQPLRISFDASLTPEVRKINPIKGIGIEGLKVTRVQDDEDGGGANIDFYYAANCWVKGVESDYSNGSHILANASTHIQITGCYVHHAYKYDGNNTCGYGITLINHTGDCLVQDNIFQTLRHAMMVKQGANGNVFGYNYSTDVKRTEIPTNGSGDIALHGHYPFANLFEGNIVQTMYIDQAWGPSGPRNTFFRNRSELYGIIISSGAVNSDDQCFIGNELTGSSFLLGNYMINGVGHYMYGNNVKGEMKPANINSLNDNSYYLDSKPHFWNISDQWPSLGYPNEPGKGSIPAYERFQKGKGLTVFYILPQADYSDGIDCSTGAVQFKDASGIADGSISKRVWYFGDGSTSKEQNPSHHFMKPGTYKVSLVVWSDLGAKDSTWGSLKIAAAPNAGFDMTREDNNKFIFKLQRADSGMSYHWDFGDGTTATTAQAQHTYAKTGDYQVKLLVSNGTCDDSHTLKLTIAGSSATSIDKIGENTGVQVYPNPFTEAFTVHLGQAGAASVQYEVYDLRGRLILTDAFKTTSAGTVDKPIDFPFEPGVYLLHFLVGSQTYYQKIIKY